MDITMKSPVSNQTIRSLSTTYSQISKTFTSLPCKYIFFKLISLKYLKNLSLKTYRSFYLMLEEANLEEVAIASCFIKKHKSFLSLYSAYCQNYKM